MRVNPIPPLRHLRMKIGSPIDDRHSFDPLPVELLVDDVVADRLAAGQAAFIIL
jgi:hypothetical protein